MIEETKTLDQERLENCADDLKGCRELMIHWWNLSAELLMALKALLDAAYDTEATGVPCVTLEPAMEAAKAIIDKAEPKLRLDTSNAGEGDGP